VPPAQTRLMITGLRSALGGFVRLATSRKAAASLVRLRRGLALPPIEQALRASQRHNHDQPQLRRVGDRVRRREDDDRSARSSYPPLPHPRNQKRQLPLQEQLGERSQTRKGETAKLDEPLTPKPSSSRFSSQWKPRVKSQWKSTPAALRRAFHYDIVSARCVRWALGILLVQANRLLDPANPKKWRGPSLQTSRTGRPPCSAQH
jgi:hypothetical protein